LATCFDPTISAELAKEFEGKWVEVQSKLDGTLTVKLAERPDRNATSQKSGEAEEKTTNTEVRMNLTDSLSCAWCIGPDEMDTKSVGSKSLNLALLQPKLPIDVYTPQAVALPYGCMQKSLTDVANKQSPLPKLQEVLSRLQPHTSNADAQVVLEEAQALIRTMTMPDGLKAALLQCMGKVGELQGESRLKQLFNEPCQIRHAWDAIRGVWASLFALRPWVSLAKAGRSFHDLNMAVLVQELIEARYAFVLHTVNPFTHDRDELYGELVQGRGESLVGNYPGRALSFAVKRGSEPRLIAFPSKSVALHTQHCLIFRSDSNGEDLEGFAGAGLFESVCAEEDKVGFVRLHRMPLVTDRNYRQKMLRAIADVGWAIEKAFDGSPQDIEGCVDTKDRIFVVQSRPQV
jgi:alpha-glucan,water dikinase